MQFILAFRSVHCGRKLWNEAMHFSGAALESEAEVAAISSASDERLGDDSAEGETVENPLSTG